MAKQSQQAKLDQKELVSAPNGIRQNKLPFRKVAAKYYIPKSTLCDYASGKVEIGCKPGPKLVEYAFEMSRIGYGHTRQQILESVQMILLPDIVLKDGRENPFHNNKPGKKWWRLFVKRHPEISLQRLTHCSKPVLWQPLQMLLPIGFQTLNSFWTLVLHLEC